MLHSFYMRFTNPLIFKNRVLIFATYLIGQKFVGQNCRNFDLVSKVLSDEKFCPSKILSNVSIQKSGKNRTKVSKFWLGVENFVRRKILSKVSIQKSGKNRTKVWKFRLGVENFVRRKFCPMKFCPIRYLNITN